MFYLSHLHIKYVCCILNDWNSFLRHSRIKIIILPAFDFWAELNWVSRFIKFKDAIPILIAKRFKLIFKKTVEKTGLFDFLFTVYKAVAYTHWQIKLVY